MTYVWITKGKVMTKNIEVGAALNPEKRDGETLIHILPEVIAQKTLVWRPWIYRLHCLESIAPVYDMAKKIHFRKKREPIQIAKTI